MHFLSESVLPAGAGLAHNSIGMDATYEIAGLAPLRPTQGGAIKFSGQLLSSLVTKPPPILIYTNWIIMGLLKALILSFSSLRALVDY